MREALLRLKTILTADADNTAYGKAWRTDATVQRDAACVVRHAIRLRRESFRLVGYVLTTEVANTVEWLDGLVEYLNDWAEAAEEGDRVKRLRDRLVIVREQLPASGDAAEHDAGISRETKV